MVKISTLFEERKISKINELEIERYVNFFENSYKDNLKHSKRNLNDFPRWSIISAYYAMHDITKLLFAKKFSIKVDFEVHATTVKLLKELLRNNVLSLLLEKGYKAFLSLANDLDEAKKERTKIQYYTGTDFLKKEYALKANEFFYDVVIKYIGKIKELLK